MLSLENLAFFTLAAAFVSFWWYSDRIKQFALGQLMRACQKQGLQLLDQTIVLRGLSLKRAPTGHLAFQRRYHFEFTSTGEARYRGEILMLGRHIVSLEMEPHIMPSQDDSLH